MSRTAKQKGRSVAKPRDQSKLPAAADPLLRPEAVALMLDMSVDSFRDLCERGFFAPPDMRFTRRSRWALSTVHKWIKANQGKSFSLAELKRREATRGVGSTQ